MNTGLSFSDKLQTLAASYEKVMGRKWRFFHCPILNCDEPGVSLCAGHITPEQAGGRLTVPQREDVDNFFGTAVQAVATAWAKAQELDERQFLLHPDLPKTLRARTCFNDAEVTIFPVQKPSHLPPDFPRLLVEQPDRSDKEFGLRIDKAALEMFAGEGISISVESTIDTISPIIATLLHSAHLTMFNLRQYEYLFSPSGMATAALLGEFYRAGRSLQRNELAHLVQEHFYSYRHVVRPFTCAHLEHKDSVRSRKFLALSSTDGRTWGLGVAIRLASTMNMVLLPEQTADGGATYERFRQQPFTFICYEHVKYDVEKWVFRGNREIHRGVWPGEDRWGSGGT